MVRATADGSVRLRFLDREFHVGVGTNELGEVDMTPRCVEPCRQNYGPIFLPHVLARVGPIWQI
jgi:hypothetical protein